MISKALIIAAGQGQRIRRCARDVPKPLRQLLGLSLLKRIVLTAQRAGIKEFGTAGKRAKLPEHKPAP